ncbi:MAG: hypothetical protein O3C10_01025 [Chloroflexi bacterium]|nr:hypothetical protein [Chloroflexota bacterium]
MVVVHGIGRQRKGETLAEVSESLALTFEETAPSGHLIGREMDISGPVSTATLRFEGDGGNLTTWTLKEALWADAFTPPSAQAVFLWTARAIPRQARYLLSLLRQPDSRTPELAPGPVQLGVQMWSEFISSWSTRLQIVLLAILLLVVSPFLIATGLGLVYLQKVPIHILHPFDPFLSRVLGDVYRYTTHGMWAASARGIIERIVIDFIEDEYSPIEDLTIVAHSMGCVVAYDALRGGGAVSDAIRRAQEKGRRKKITLVTIGSGINQVFAVARRSETYGKTHFCQPLDPDVTGSLAGVGTDSDLFEWVDIYARMDLVPAGGLTPEIRARSGASAEQYHEVRVTNTDIPFKDHTSYFQNRTTVVPRVIRAINGGEEYRPDRGTLASTNQEGDLSDRHHARTSSRKRQVFNAFLRTLIPIVLFGFAIGIWYARSSPEEGFLDSFGNGPWALELALLLAALWIGRLLTAGLMVIATIGFVGGWVWLSESLVDGVWIWAMAAGPWAIELAVVYITIFWALYMRRRRNPPGEPAEWPENA